MKQQMNRNKIHFKSDFEGQTNYSILREFHKQKHDNFLVLNATFYIPLLLLLLELKLSEILVYRSIVQYFDLKLNNNKIYIIGENMFWNLLFIYQLLQKITP